MKVESLEQALSRMAALCSASEHCESEIRERLQKSGLSATDIQRVVDRLYDECYLDTTRFCHAFSRDKLRFTHWGRIKIQQALRMKGLPDNDIREALDALPEDEYRQVLVLLLRQKARTLTDDDPYIRRGKLLRFAAGRGFTPEEMRECESEITDIS